MDLDEFRAAIGTEKRTIATPFEFRDASADKPPVLQGHAAVFDRTSGLVSEGRLKFHERIKRGAFRKALDESHDVRLLINHDDSSVLARTRSKSLELREDPKGLRVYATLDPSDPDTQRLLPKMRRGDIDAMSFGFTVAKGGDSWQRTGRTQIRTIHEVDQLLDVSVATYPAYSGADVLLRSKSFDVDDESVELIMAELEELEESAVDLSPSSGAETRAASAPESEELAVGVASPDAEPPADEGMDERSLLVASLEARVLALRIAAL